MIAILQFDAVNRGIFSSLLEQGRLPTYVHDRDNGTSAFVARAVGFQLYAEIVLSEY